MLADTLACVPLAADAAADARQVNEGGLEGLYRVLLSDSAEWFVAALRQIQRVVEGEQEQVAVV